ncbi:MAG: ABC transporter ATP-binding protein/permease [Lactococcus sp.]|uniref:Multidrug resistance ABC transporter ATP-binding/permease protein n=1 Tax=Pseudolactococcus piscium MKFS47 TaxID=297352 RepID=A0A0D6DZ42_9LACT|nr:MULTISPECIES: ABC transporter ATP-binding protein [Lactococcus]MBR6894630.1 ABC transporter ATP-binding protein [Lactococcus sp.]MDN5403391.1 ABC transporter ATP-binding protein/permease [Lactococcus sp.]MDN5409207.1 ABC transporter ATP-binding protein/permease [Lactococcus sp.]MDN5411972.1 ABC transporter ATP-binding protein/permease [Lactococcus sp.]MDN5435747.1 ABC transporter ATP-binding protein/permease [Lactococcus sp.]
MFKILKKLTGKELRYVGISLIFIITQVYLDLKLPDYMSKVTKLIQEKGTTVSQIFDQGKWMVLCALGSLAAAIVVGYFAARVAAGLSRTLRHDVYHQVSEYSMAEINQFSTASLITRSTNDITQVQMFVAMGLQLIIKAPITAVWAIFKIADKSWEWTTALGVAVLFILVAISIIVTLAMPRFKIIQKLTDKLNSVTRENLTGIHVVRAYNAEGYQTEKFERANADITSTNLFIQRVMAFMMPMMSMVSSGLSVAVYLIGATIIKNAAIGTPGNSPRINLFSDMVVFTSYGMQVVMAFMMLTMIFIMMPRANVSAGRINEVIDTDSSIKNGTKDGDTTTEVGTVEFKNVYFQYADASEHVIEGISFKANKGETVAFIGSTGSGKSTLINLIPRYYDVTAGQVLVDGVNVKDYTENALHNKMGFIPQKPVMFNGTIRSNLAFGTNASGDLTDEALMSAVRLAQAEEFVTKNEKGLDAEISQGGLNLSGGQKQRLAIARALARRPEILVFDDSFSALDYKTDRVLRDTLNRETAETTKLIVAQRIGTIIDADQIIVLDKGKVVGHGTHTELLASNPVYQEIAYSQLSKEELA